MGAGLDIDGLLQAAVGRCLGSLIGNTDALPALAVAEYGQVGRGIEIMPAVVHQAPAAGRDVRLGINEHPAAVLVNIAVLVCVDTVQINEAVVLEIDAALAKGDLFTADMTGHGNRLAVVIIGGHFMVGSAIIVKIMPGVLACLKELVLRVDKVPAAVLIVISGETFACAVPAFRGDFGCHQGIQLIEVDLFFRQSFVFFRGRFRSGDGGFISLFCNLFGCFLDILFCLCDRFFGLRNGFFRAGIRGFRFLDHFFGLLFRLRFDGLFYRLNRFCFLFLICLFNNGLACRCVIAGLSGIDVHAGSRDCRRGHNDCK